MTLQQFVRTTLVTQLAAHLQDIEFSPGQIGASLSILAFFGVTSKIVFGRVSEAITARWSYALVVGIQLVGIAGFLFLAERNFPLVFVFLSVFGLGMGGIGTLGPLAVTEMFGLKNYGSISGMIRQGVVAWAYNLPAASSTCARAVAVVWPTCKVSAMQRISPLSVATART